MDAAHTLHTIITKIWNIAKKYAFKNLNDEDWEAYIKEIDEEYKKMKNADEATKKFLRDLILALTNYMEKKNNGSTQILE